MCVFRHDPSAAHISVFRHNVSAADICPPSRLPGFTLRITFAFTLVPPSYQFRAHPGSSLMSVSLPTLSHDHSDTPFNSASRSTLLHVRFHFFTLSSVSRSTSLYIQLYLHVYLPTLRCSTPSPASSVRFKPVVGFCSLVILSPHDHPKRILLGDCALKQKQTSTRALTGGPIRGG